MLLLSPRMLIMYAFIIHILNSKLNSQLKFNLRLFRRELIALKQS